MFCWKLCVSVTGIQSTRIQPHIHLENPLFRLFLQETDKATIDVEAQDDGIMGKILVSHIWWHT